MQVSRRNFGKAVIGLGLLASTVAVWSSWPTEPGARFRAVTGRELPPGVHAAAYARENTDNLVRPTHYWLLKGSPDALRRVAESHGFIESFEDARATLPELRRLFDVRLTAEDVVAGFEREAGRDQWLCILGDGTTALYAH